MAAAVGADAPDGHRRGPLQAPPTSVLPSAPAGRETASICGEVIRSGVRDQMATPASERESVQSGWPQAQEFLQAAANRGSRQYRDEKEWWLLQSSSGR
jgi:hypothetical protein